MRNPESKAFQNSDKCKIERAARAAQASSKPTVVAKLPVNATPADHRKAAPGYRSPFYTAMTPVVSELLGMDITGALASGQPEQMAYSQFHQKAAAVTTIAAENQPIVREMHPDATEAHLDP